ncbi:hypothetical protein Asp14428_02820 [Actinoplanes sp. NBRC 14428]|nr:hypothetical protein Asp14428_02820 [Actinoplanes sp. NBRC 14428]
MNRAVLGDQVPPDLLTRVLRTEVLPGLPAPERLDPAEARRQVVHLGLTGASVARHFQERTPGGKSEPERAFDGLVVGPSSCRSGRTSRRWPTVPAPGTAIVSPMRHWYAGT